MHSSTGCPPTSPWMLPLPLSPSLIPSSSFLCVASVQDLTAPSHCLSSPCWDPFNSLPPHPHLSLRPPPLSLSSSPALQTVQRFVYVLLVEAGHVSVHVPVVVADVALCAPVGHRAKPERRWEFVWILELWQGVFRKRNHRENERGHLVSVEKGAEPHQTAVNAPLSSITVLSRPTHLGDSRHI